MGSRGGGPHEPARVVGGAMGGCGAPWGAAEPPSQELLDKLAKARSPDDLMKLAGGAVGGGGERSSC